MPTGSGTVTDTGAHNGGTHGMVPVFWDLALGPTFVSLFGLKVCSVLLRTRKRNWV